MKEEREKKKTGRGRGRKQGKVAPEPLVNIYLHFNGYLLPEETKPCGRWRLRMPAQRLRSLLLTNDCINPLRVQGRLLRHIRTSACREPVSCDGAFVQGLGRVNSDEVSPRVLCRRLGIPPSIGHGLLCHKQTGLSRKSGCGIFIFLKLETKIQQSGHSSKTISTLSVTRLT